MAQNGFSQRHVKLFLDFSVEPSCNGKAWALSVFLLLKGSDAISPCGRRMGALDKEKEEESIQYVSHFFLFDLSRSKTFRSHIEDVKYLTLAATTLCLSCPTQC